MAKTSEYRDHGAVVVVYYCPHCQAEGEVEHVNPETGSKGHGCLRGEF